MNTMYTRKNTGMTTEQKKIEIAKNLLLEQFCEKCFSYMEIGNKGVCTLKHNTQRRLYNTCEEFLVDIEIPDP
jgi:hypothetical protein